MEYGRRMRTIDLLLTLVPWVVANLALLGVYAEERGGLGPGGVPEELTFLARGGRA